MKRYHLNNMQGGWFIGDFLPTVFKNKAFEVGIKYYQAGEENPCHIHRHTTEISAIVSGQVVMMEQTLNAGDIIVIEPGEASAFLALQNSALVVVKYPSIPDDKYPVGE